MYVPIVPMVLINGSAGIGTAWSTYMPNHDIRACIANVKKMINGGEPDGQFKSVIMIFIYEYIYIEVIINNFTIMIAPS